VVVPGDSKARLCDAYKCFTFSATSQQKTHASAGTHVAVNTCYQADAMRAELEH